LIPENELAEVRRMAEAMAAHPNPEVRTGAAATLRFVKHIAALEQALASAVPGAHLREVDAAGVRATQNGMAARISELEQHITAQGARIAALEASAKEERKDAFRVACSRLRSIMAEHEGDTLPADYLYERIKGLEARLGEDELPEPLTARVAQLEQHISDLEKSLENVRRERDEAYQKGRDDERAIAIPSGQVAGMRERLGKHLMDWAPTPFAGQSAVAELDRLAAKAQGYEAAVADNAALVEHARSLYVHAPPATAHTDRGVTERWDAAKDAHVLLLRQSHPGAALLERMKRLEEALDEIAQEPPPHIKDAQRISETALGRLPCQDGSCVLCRSGEPCH
jgi:uncharacterized coiled-coil protein SlyX